jgi:hypothetical protein
MTVKYIALDTNIFVNFLETGFRIGTQAGVYNISEEAKVLANLFKALTKGKIKLLLPEIILLEIERIEKEKKEELNNMFKGAMEQVRSFALPPNKKIAENTLDKIEANMDKLCREEKRKNDKVWKLLKQIFKQKNTIYLPLDEQILLSAYKRGLMGKKPFVSGYSGRDTQFKKGYPSHNIQPDCIFIENIKLFLSDKKGFSLYLGTNDSNFYKSIDKKELDSSIKVELKVKDYSTTLSELLKKAIGLKTSKKPKAKKEEHQAYPIIAKILTEGGTVIDVTGNVSE